MISLGVRKVVSSLWYRGHTGRATGIADFAP